MTLSLPATRKYMLMGAHQGLHRDVVSKAHHAIHVTQVQQEGHEPPPVENSNSAESVVHRLSESAMVPSRDRPQWDNGRKTTKPGQWASSIDFSASTFIFNTVPVPARKRRSWPQRYPSLLALLSAFVF